VWTTHGPDDGRVNAIAVDPSIPTTVYAGTDGGGFFKSLDAGDGRPRRSSGPSTRSSGLLALGEIELAGGTSVIGSPKTPGISVPNVPPQSVTPRHVLA